MPRVNLQLCIGTWVMCLITYLSGCASPGDKHVFRYDASSVDIYLRKHGMHPESRVYRSWENGSGTRIYFQQDSMTGPVWVVSAEWQSPHLVEFKASCGWIDDEDQFRPLPAYARSAKLTCEVDEQSGYFYQGDRDAGLIYIGHCNDPNGYLVRCRTDWTTFWPDQICTSGDSIILLQVRDLNRRTWFQHFNNCWIFRRTKDKPHEWVKEERQLDGTCICADPFAHRLLCQSYGGIFHPTSLFLYDIDSGSITTYPPQLVRRFAFILRNDLFGQRFLPAPKAEKVAQTFTRVLGSGMG
ncbi:MAG TPA: hypothetical protein VIM11_14550 [Tepidisphaeraceae bacterium]